MDNWSPGEWATFFLSAGGFVTVICVQIANAVISIRNGRKADANAARIDENTQITKFTQATVQTAVDTARKDP